MIRAVLEVWLVALFGSTALGELLNYRHFLAALVSHGWTWRVAQLLARAVPFISLTIAALLVLRVHTALVAVGTYAVLSIYLLYKIVLLRRRPGTSCGCGGQVRALDHTDLFASGVHCAVAIGYLATVV